MFSRLILNMSLIYLFPFGTEKRKNLCPHYGMLHPAPQGHVKISLAEAIDLSLFAR